MKLGMISAAVLAVIIVAGGKFFFSFFSEEESFVTTGAISCVNLATVALLVLVFHVGIWGVWTGTLAAQAVQAFLLRRYVAKSEELTPINGRI